MKKRIAKKQAHAYMDGRKKYPVQSERFMYDTDGNYCIKYRAVMPQNVYNWVRWYAFRAGWYGCHWDAPDIVNTWFPN